METFLQGTGSLLGRTIARIILSKVSTRASTHRRQFHSKGFLPDVGDLDFACSGVDSFPVRDGFGCADGGVELSKRFDTAEKALLGALLRALWQAAHLSS